jgi:sulfite dehydrogenase (quinone) subunit SoeC
MGLGAALGALPPVPSLGALGLGVALLLVVAGLFASTLHLRRKMRAWRALSQWRSSWLSREGVAALATFVPAALFFASWAGGASTPGALGLATAIGAVLTVICTGQIYASLKPIARWNHVLTTPCYVALALATGTLGAAAADHLTVGGTTWLDIAALLLLPAAWLLKLAWWRQTDATSSPATPETATGLVGFGRVRLLQPPHTEENYLLHEMGFRLARKHSVKLRRLAVLVGCLGPWLLVLATTLLGRGWVAALLGGLAFLLALAGTLVERWLFFAEARHTVSLYYGAQAA